MLEQREGLRRGSLPGAVDLDLLSECNCSMKGILHLPIAVEDFELMRGKTH